MTRNRRIPWVLAVIVTAGLVAGCRSSGDAREGKKEMTDEEKEKEIVKTAVNPWGYVPFSFPIVVAEGDPETCDVHDVKRILRSVKVFQGEYPLDEAYRKELLTRFPNCDDPVLYDETHKGKLYVNRSVCPLCCEERDAYLVKRFGK